MLYGKIIVSFLAQLAGVQVWNADTFFFKKR